jgi:hypothetical protein
VGIYQGPNFEEGLCALMEVSIDYFHVLDVLKVLLLLFLDFTLLKNWFQQSLKFGSNGFVKEKNRIFHQK